MNTIYRLTANITKGREVIEGLTVTCTQEQWDFIKAMLSGSLEPATMDRCDEYYKVPNYSVAEGRK